MAYFVNYWNDPEAWCGSEQCGCDEDWEVRDSDGVLVADDFQFESEAQAFADHLNRNNIGFGEGVV